LVTDTDANLLAAALGSRPAGQIRQKGHWEFMAYTEKWIMPHAFVETFKMAYQTKVHMGTAANIFGVERVNKAMKLRGIYP